MYSFDERLQILLEGAFKEDMGEGDHSSLSCISPDARGRAVLNVKEAGILAGIAVAEEIFLFREPSAVFVPFKKDGDAMHKGEIAFEVEASVYTILAVERILLNCMQRMSGIATLTNQFVSSIQGYKTRILDTRKTTPNFRLLEKEAVRIGGGLNHRFGLYDMIMLKDNHIDYCGGIERAIENAHRYVQSYKPGLKIEVETRTIEDVKKTMASGKVDRIMLDNFPVSQVTEALKIIGGRCETEASGGINLDNVMAYAATGVDYISIGALIQQAKSLDLSLKAAIHDEH